MNRQALRGADGVHGPSGLLEEAGYVNVNDVPGVRHGPFHQKNGAPRFTVWAGATVDHAYFKAEETEDAKPRVHVDGVFTIPVLLSDHLPTVIDLSINL